MRPLTPQDAGWVARFVAERWGSAVVVSRGRVHTPASLPGFLAVRDGEPVGLVTYEMQGDRCEVVTLDSLARGKGIGTALIDEVRRAAGAAGCRRLWLISTNDNLGALRFYQKVGFALVALYPDAIGTSRQLKPEIPLIGEDGIPIRDEIELAMELRQSAGA
jgi:ribosomal protein S18 acetylase RimI-like enzyme